MKQKTDKIIMERFFSLPYYLREQIEEAYETAVTEQNCTLSFVEYFDEYGQTAIDLDKEYNESRQ